MYYYDGQAGDYLLEGCKVISIIMLFKWRAWSSEEAFKHVESGP